MLMLEITDEAVLCSASLAKYRAAFFSNIALLFSAAQLCTQLQNVALGSVQFGGLGLWRLRFDGLDPLVQAVRRNAQSLGYLGNRIAALDDLSDDLVFELRGVTLTAHRSSSMLK